VTVFSPSGKRPSANTLAACPKEVPSLSEPAPVQRRTLTSHRPSSFTSLPGEQASCSGVKPKFSSRSSTRKTTAWRPT
jgi:hypothetical protein